MSRTHAFVISWYPSTPSMPKRRGLMQGRPHVCMLFGSLVLLLMTLLMACPSATAQTSAAPQATSEAPDAGLLKAPEASPKRGGILRWGGLANSTLYDLHQ